MDFQKRYSVDLSDIILFVSIPTILLLAIVAAAIAGAGEDYRHGVCTAKGGKYITSNICIKEDALIKVDE